MPPIAKPTACLALADGTLFYGQGFGATGQTEAELCFNTAMSGYQEIMTDPSYAGQIVTFTFPHIGNVGANEEDHESRGLGAVGLVVRQEITPHSSFRAQNEFVEWCVTHGKIGLSGVDTRALTRRIRMSGAPNAVIANDPHGEFDLKALKKQAKEWGGLEGLDLVPARARAAYGSGASDRNHDGFRQRCIGSAGRRSRRQRQKLGGPHERDRTQHRHARQPLRHAQRVAGRGTHLRDRPGSGNAGRADPAPSS